MSEAKKEPEIIDTRPANTGIATVDVRDASAAGLALMRQRVEAQGQMIRLAISLTSKEQWTVFSGVDKKTGEVRETIYPTGGAADTILRRAFGLTWGPKVLTVEEGPDGKMATCTATLFNGQDPVEEFTGYRYMGGFVNDEAALRKGAVENMKSVAVRDILGLRFRSPVELRDLGLDATKLTRRAEFQNHEKQDNELTAPFGKQKGQPLSALEDANLTWLRDAVAKSIADPEKAKYKPNNQRLHAACESEIKRRLGGGDAPSSAKLTSQAAKNAPPPDPDGMPPFDEPDANG
jgi:hypothetical protein